MGLETAERGGNGFTPVNHLMSELRAELDWATHELSIANNRLAELESTLNAAYHDVPIDEKKIERMSMEREIEEAKLQIDSLYDLHHIARTRFEKMEMAFEIARQYNLLSVVSVNLRNLLLVGQPDLRSRLDVRAALAAIGSALHDYCWVEPSDEADARVRSTLMHFESCVAWGE
ncbi:MAG: hypothetical protein H7840_17020 [Alphaproteobacteria bacterium]